MTCTLHGVVLLLIPVGSSMIYLHATCYHVGIDVVAMHTDRAMMNYVCTKHPTQRRHHGSHEAMNSHASKVMSSEFGMSLLVASSPDKNHFLIIASHQVSVPC